MTRKVILIGLDSLQSDFAARFIREGRMPNLRTVKERGFYTDVLPTLPPLTPPGWVTIATGAWPGTHGILDFYLHEWGDPFDKVHNGCMSHKCRAEFIWNAAGRQGKRSILIKFPCSFPPGLQHGIQVDGSAGYGLQHCYYELTEATAFCNDPNVRGAKQVKFRSPSSWRYLPPNIRSIKETEITLPQRDNSTNSICFHVLAFKSDDGLGVIITQNKNLRTPYEKIEVGKWTDWIVFESVSKGEKVEGALRMKLLKISQDLNTFHLFATASHRTTGYTEPKQISEEIYHKIGPFLEFTGVEREGNRVDDTTLLELYRMNMEFMRDTACFLMKTQEWDLLMLQWHPLDYVKHVYYGCIDPEHPDYSPQKADYYWDIIGKTYEMADELLGTLYKMADSNVVLMIASDHGHDLAHTTFFTNQFLINEGLLAIEEKGGEVTIDLSNTKAYAGVGVLPGIYINLKGREESGIVELGREYESICQSIVERLKGLVDPLRDLHVISHIWQKKDFGGIGLNGPNVPDIVFATRKGYEPISTTFYDKCGWGMPVAIRRRVGPMLRDDGSLFESRSLFSTHTSGHESVPFTARTVRVPLYIVGPGVKRGCRHHPINMVDIAPTMAKVLEIDPPRNCEGQAISEAFE